MQTNASNDRFFTWASGAMHLKTQSVDYEHEHRDAEHEHACSLSTVPCTSKYNMLTVKAL
jgi:hypothetical protein